MKHFLIVYDQRTGTILSLKEFDEFDRDRASQLRLGLESEHRDEPGVEIVVLSSTSLESLRKTHGRYFKSIGELATEG